MFYGIKRLFENFKYIQLITVEKPLSLDKEKLMKLAKEFLNYNRETKVALSLVQCVNKLMP